MMLVYKYRNFYEMVEANAKLIPNKTALFIDKRKVSNLRLKEKVDTFARFLEFSAVKNGDKVAIIVANSEEFIVSFLAITKIGAVAVPINTFLKYEELAYIVQDSDSKLVISSPELCDETKNLLNIPRVEKIVWTGKYEKLDEKNYSFLEITNSMETHEQISNPPNLNDLACIIYTSGTTGKPKGAMLTYRNMFSNMVAGDEVFNITGKDRFIVYLPMFHSFTLTIMVLLPLYAQSSLIIVKSIFPFSNVLKQTLLKGVTIFLGAPAVYNAMLKAKIPWYFMFFNKIRLFISGSAPLSQQAIDDFAIKFKKATLLEGYGLSECSPAVAVNRQELQKPLSVGPALPSYEIKIVNDEMMELPLGEVGEVIVRGDCVMKGYYNRPDATDETIVNGWLLTGDLGKMDEDGYLYIVDRKKDLIISKGINIYPREIEELLYKYEGIEACAVIGVKDKSADEDVLAFIQTKDGVDEIPEKLLRKYLKSHLANFKIPKQFYTVEELPKNATGKVLKRVLKDEVAKGKFKLK